MSDYIYTLGIGLTTIPPNFGKVWYPCFDNFVERATYTYHVTSAAGKAYCYYLIGEQGRRHHSAQLRTDSPHHNPNCHGGRPMDSTGA